MTGRPTPGWYDDAKLGIFVHWGLYSVPGWAPTTGTLDEAPTRLGWQVWFRDNPYAEWYANSLKIPDSPTAAHHRATYGEARYEDFVPAFNEAIRAWDPAAWAELFKQAGAGYVVLTTKHHDGFRLWPSQVPHPTLGDFHAARDLVGELAEAVRAAGLRFGTYYSGGLDWSVNPTPIMDLPDLGATVIQDPAYVAYADAHWRELIDRYETTILWNDIAYPRRSELATIVADFYRRMPDGLVNDRFQDIGRDGARVPLVPPDMLTPEYTSFADIRAEKWETDPRHRLLLRLQPGRGRGQLHPDRRPDPPLRRHRQQERQPAPQRRTAGGRQHPGRATGPAAGARRLAGGQRRGDLRDAALAGRRGHDRRRHPGSLHAQGRRALRDPARAAAAGAAGLDGLRGGARHDRLAAGPRSPPCRPSRAATGSRSRSPRRCPRRRPTRCASSRRPSRSDRPRRSARRRLENRQWSPCPSQSRPRPTPSPSRSSSSSGATSAPDPDRGRPRLRGDLAPVDHRRPQPGERLSDVELAAQLGVSRTPVRQALHRLAQDELSGSTPAAASGSGPSPPRTSTRCTTSAPPWRRSPCARPRRAFGQAISGPPRSRPPAAGSRRRRAGRALSAARLPNSTTCSSTPRGTAG